MHVAVGPLPLDVKVAVAAALAPMLHTTLTTVFAPLLFGFVNASCTASPATPRQECTTLKSLWSASERIYAQGGAAGPLQVLLVDPCGATPEPLARFTAARQRTPLERQQGRP